MATGVSIRPARADELPLVLAIDDDATRLYALAGIVLGLEPGHRFLRAEQARWARALAAGGVYLAEDGSGRALGLAVLATVDGAPYLDQVSVRLDDMGRGVGRALVAHAVEWARQRGDALWLSTYGHLSWNRPFYERVGFVVVPEDAWGPEMRAIVAEQRECLPHPEERVVMRHRG